MVNKNTPILNTIQKQILLMSGISGTPLEKQYSSALAELTKYEQKYQEDYFKPKYQCEWIGLEEDNTKWNKDCKN